MTSRASRLRTYVALTGAAAMTGLLLAGPATAGPQLVGSPAASGASDWTEIGHSHGSGQDSYLYDVWAAGEEVWSAGTRRTYVGGVYEWRTLVQRCSGGTCTATYPRDYENPPYTTNFLQGISGTSSSDVWAVGYARINGVTAATTHHFDGSAWTAVPNPGTSGALYGVSAIAPDDVWAVGAEGSFAPQGQLVLHWDGSTWTKVPFAIEGCPAYDYLYDVAADGRRPLVIGRCRVEEGPLQALAASYRNGQWVRENVRGLDAETASFAAVAWVGRQAWLGGSDSTTNPASALTARLRKGDWRVKATPGPGAVYGIDGAAPKDVWAVGIKGSFGRLSLHWDGQGWTDVDAGDYSWLESVAITGSGTPWAVGQDYGQSLILRYDGPLAAVE